MDEADAVTVMQVFAVGIKVLVTYTNCKLGVQYKSQHGFLLSTSYKLQNV